MTQNKNDADKEKLSQSSETVFREGDHVEWNSPNGKISGTVEEKLTEETQIKGHTVKASPENPEYRVKSEKTGAEAAHKPEGLRKVSN